MRAFMCHCGFQCVAVGSKMVSEIAEYILVFVDTPGQTLEYIIYKSNKSRRMPLSELAISRTTPDNEAS